MSDAPLTAPETPIPAIPAPEAAAAPDGALPLPPFLPGVDEAAPGAPGTQRTDAAPSPAEAQEALFRQRLEAQDDSRRRQWREQVEQWRRDVAADPEMGGDRLAGTVARAQLALERFDTDGSIGRLLEESGYGNHPAVIRFFNRMADGLMEDSLPQSRPDLPLQPLEERMYAGWSSRP